MNPPLLQYKFTHPPQVPTSSSRAKTFSGGGAGDYERAFLGRDDLMNR
jgi:hypothetical protein